MIGGGAVGILLPRAKPPMIGKVRDRVGKEGNIAETRSWVISPGLGFLLGGGNLYPVLLELYGMPRSKRIPQMGDLFLAHMG